jgi:hypothetical protein
VFPNISNALHIFGNLHTSVASGERTFNMLKQVKSYCITVQLWDKIV